MTQPSFKNRKPRSASVKVQQVRTITDDEVFQAENEDRERITKERVGINGNAADESATLLHRRPDTIAMWKPSARGFVRRVVSVTAIGPNLRNGWRSKCPHCNGDHGGGPNDCLAREPVAYRICPVCQKLLYDNLGGSDVEAEDDDDPNLIKDDMYTASTPAQRTRLQLELHLWIRHPRTAQVMNLPPLPEAFREIAEGARPV